MSIGAHGQCNIEAHQKRYKTLKNQQKSAENRPKVSLKHLNYSPIGTHWSILHGIPTEISQQTHIMAKTQINNQKALKFAKNGQKSMKKGLNWHFEYFWEIRLLGL